MLGPKLVVIDLDRIVDMSLRRIKLHSEAAMVRQVIAAEMLKVIRQIENVLESPQGFEPEPIEYLRCALGFPDLGLHLRPRSADYNRFIPAATRYPAHAAYR